MKKIIYSLFVMAMAAMTFVSCEDVPAPYDMPDPNGGGGSGTETVEPKGSGTLEDPFNAAAAIEYCSKLESGAESPNDVYIYGKVVSIDENYTTQFGNAKFYISEDGSTTKQFLVYRALYLGNKKYTSGDLLQEGDDVIICGKVTNYNGTYETQQNKAFLYSLNGKSEGGNGNTPTGDAKGSGTQTDPYNPAGAAAAVANLTWTSNDTYDTTGDVYVKGKISRIADKGTFTEGGNYGNASFYISEDGTENGEFYCFRILYLGNKKFEAGKTDIKVGDEVIICGQLMNYRGNTPETVAGKAYLYSLNGKTESGSGGGGGGGGEAGKPSGDGTLSSPYNVAAACAAVKDLTWTSNNEYQTTNEVYVKGKISKIADNGTYGESGTYGNASFYIKDDGADAEFYCYRLLYLGNKKYESGQTDIKVGDEVVIYGKLMNYRGNTPETVANQTYLYSLNGKTEGGSGGGGGGGGSSTEPTSGDNGTFEAWTGGVPDNWKPASSAGNATLSQSNDAHGGSYSCKVAGDTKANKRLGYKELKLAAGTYKVTFYAKGLSAGGSVNPGFVDITDGKAGSYKYAGYVDNVNTGDWQKVEATLEIPSDGIYCFVIMNQKKSEAVDILIDDFTVVTGSTSVIK